MDVVLGYCCKFRQKSPRNIALPPHPPQRQRNSAQQAPQLQSTCHQTPHPSPLASILCGPRLNSSWVQPSYCFHGGGRKRGGCNLGNNKGRRHSKVKGAETGWSFNFSKSTGRFSEGKPTEGFCSAFSPTVHSKFPRLVLGLDWVLLWLV